MDDLQLISRIREVEYTVFSNEESFLERFRNELSIAEEIIDFHIGSDCCKVKYAVDDLLANVMVNTLDVLNWVDEIQEIGE